MTETGERTAKVTLPSDTEVLVTRGFDAPRHLVYRAWTTPELVKRWWSGRRGEMTVAEIDLRVGGDWRYAMVAEGGFEVAFHGTYSEVVENERLVTTEVFEGMPGAEAATNVITFTETEGRTRLELLMQVSSKEVRDMVLSTGMETGVQEQMLILDELLAEG